MANLIVCDLSMEEGIVRQDEYLLGDDLLVAPLLEENAVSRRVYLPEGTWFDFFDGKAHQGGQTITAGGNGKLPVFTRNGFIR